MLAAELGTIKEHMGEVERGELCLDVHLEGYDEISGSYQENVTQLKELLRAEVKYPDLVIGGLAVSVLVDTKSPTSFIGDFGGSCAMLEHWREDEEGILRLATDKEWSGFNGSRALIKLIRHSKRPRSLQSQRLLSRAADTIIDDGLITLTTYNQQDSMNDETFIKLRPKIIDDAFVGSVLTHIDRVNDQGETLHLYSSNTAPLGLITKRGLEIERKRAAKDLAKRNLKETIDEMYPILGLSGGDTSFGEIWRARIMPALNRDRDMNDPKSELSQLIKAEVATLDVLEVEQELSKRVHNTNLEYVVNALEESEFALRAMSRGRRIRPTTSQHQIGMEKICV